MRKSIIFILLTSIFFSFSEKKPFKEEQLTYERVRKVFAEREIEVQTSMLLAGVNYQAPDLYIRAFKKEGILELWGRNHSKDIYKLISTYPFCSNVGVLGPKRKQGDFQIPEGFYHLSKFNPNSNYHLSLQVSYPNKSDSLLSKHKDLGGLIFIHGGCLTIGCIPITDEKIEELYVASVMARAGGQEEIPIHIFPSRMNYSNYRSLMESTSNRELQVFWTNLKPVYQHFEQTGKLLHISINHQGRYLFSE